MAGTSEIVIRVRELAKAFGALRAVEGVSFDVHKGEVFGILGPNGAGKTTLLECMEGIQKSTSGAMEVLGMDVGREAKRVQERIGVQLQSSAYFDYLTLREILSLFGRFYRRRIAPEVLLAKVGLEEKAGTTIAKLSGGQRQRFTIAAALVNDADLVFLDEPTTGLDPQARRSLWQFIQQVHDDGRTVVLTTHYMEEAQFLCQRVAIMDHGRIVALDTPDDLIHMLPVPYEVRFIAEPLSDADELRGLDAVVEMRLDGNGGVLLRSSDAARTMPGLLGWASLRGIQLRHLEIAPSTLEDVFLGLTGRELRD